MSVTALAFTETALVMARRLASRITKAGARNEIRIGARRFSAMTARIGMAARLRTSAIALCAGPRNIVMGTRATVKNRNSETASRFWRGFVPTLLAGSNGAARPVAGAGLRGPCRPRLGLLRPGGGALRQQHLLGALEGPAGAVSVHADFDGSHQLGDLLAPPALRAFADRLQNLRMGGLPDLFVVVDQLLEQALTRAQAGEHDFDVLVGREPVEADQRLRQVDDPDRLAHIEDEDFAAVPHGSGLEDQLDGLGDRHEEARDLGMGHRHGAAALDLLLEQRDDAAAGLQYVAEAHGQVLGGAGPVQALEQQLRHALGAAHHAQRLHGLVGRDEHEHLGAVLAGKVGHHLRAEHVRLERLDGIALHHRDVLVRGRMKNRVRRGLLEDSADALLVHDVADDRLDLELRVRPAKLLVDHVEALLVLLVEHQDARTARRYLTRDLRADRAAGPGVQDPARRVEAGHRAQIDLDRLSEEQIVRLEFLNQAMQVLTGQDLGKVRDELGRLVELLALAKDRLAIGFRRRGEGDQDLVRILTANRALEIVDTAQHGSVVDPRAAALGVVVDQPDDAIFPAAGGEQAAHDPLRGIARADDQNAARPGRRPAQLAMDAADETDAAEQREREDQVDEDYGPRIGRERRDRPRQGPPDGGAERQGQRDRLEILDAHVPPESAIQPERIEEEEPDREDDRRRRQEQPELLLRNPPVVEDQEGAVLRQDQQRALDDRGDRVPVRRQRIERAIDGLAGIGEGHDRHEDQLQVVQERAPCDVLHGQTQFLGKDDANVLFLGLQGFREERRFVAVGDGGQVRDAGTNRQNLRVLFLEQGHVLRQLGTRSHQAHVAPEDVE